MSEFARRIERIDALSDLSSRPADHWWKDLLSLWRPSGIDAGAYGLRLAIRNGYMNFYQRGQSIARIQVDSKGAPTATVHIKYVCGKSVESQSQEYMKLRDGWVLRDGEQLEKYQGLQTLRKWINRVDEEYAGDEKCFVDKLVAANPNIIDLEMGLPAWKE